jgi:Calcineurin-like phosphoesterase
MGSRSLLVLHLSDLHFGPHCRFAGQDMKALAEKFFQAAEEARGRAGIAGKVGLVVVTGDIPEAAKPREYEEALRFFEGLVGVLGIDRRYFVFAPGNHDVSWTQCRRVDLDQEEEGFGEAEWTRRIGERKLKPYEDFVAAFYGPEHKDRAGALPLGRGAFVHNFAEHELSVAVLNSCEGETHKKQGGLLSEAQAQALMSYWRTAGLKSWLKLVAIHHNPVATERSNEKSWVDYLRKQAATGVLKEEVIPHFAADLMGFEGRERLRHIAEDCAVQFILHGHHHASEREAWPWRKGDPGQTQILSAGSWGLKTDKLPQDQKSAFQLLWIDPEKPELWAGLRVYEPKARADGAVEPGHFALDPEQPEGVRLLLSLPPGFKKEPPPAKPPEEPANDFIREYRTRLRTKYNRWDLGSIGAVQPGGAGKPLVMMLDAMYIPLRLGPKFINGLVSFKPISPEDLLGRKMPLAIRGAAGTGKTTWMRYTFRWLIEMPTALPIMVELRDLARIWLEKGAPRSVRNLDAYLRGWVGQWVGAGWEEALSTALRSNTGPRPILLIDGWDEVGELGDELREQLDGFLNVHPRALAVVSSRPYGKGQPSRAERFQIVDIQPLSDDEITDLAARFFAEIDAGEVHQRFRSALAGSPDVQALARIPLLLTMMLLISRDRPLPDKRHELYEECLKNLLSARPDQRKVEGAECEQDYWCPTDGADRIKIVAELAFRMQDDGYQRDQRQPIVRTKQELMEILPRDWNEERRSRFLAWLAGPAGVMIDRTDSTLVFTHLSFQEYLAARYFHVQKEGAEDRVAVCRQRMYDVNWWETLRLWAAQVEGRNADHLQPVLEALIDGEPEGFWLAGTMYADGLGQSTFRRWMDGLEQRFHASERPWWTICARAWTSSRQEERRRAQQIICEVLVERWSWFQWHEAAAWVKETGGDKPLRQPSSASPAGRILDVLAGKVDDARGIALGRVFAGSSPSWPGAPIDLPLLRLWPGHRARTGLRLQTLASIVGPSDGLFPASRFLRKPEGSHSNFARTFTLTFASDIGRAVVGDFARALASDFGADFVGDVGGIAIRDFARAFAFNIVFEVTRALVLDSARTFASAFARDIVRTFVCDIARAFARALDLPESTRWLSDFAILELNSWGRVGTRSVLAHVSNPNHHPGLHLFSTASRLSLRPRSDPAPFEQALVTAPADIDPLWPALARHIARRSTPEDRALLEDLACHPEKREPPLSWGLKYYVRGDVILPDGSEVTLDQLCDEAGLPHLPYLEDMPDELEVNWGRDE